MGNNELGMSVAADTVPNMTWIDWAAQLLAAREVIPGDDADLTRVLRDPGSRAVLMDQAVSDDDAVDLARYIRGSITEERVAHWKQVLAGIGDRDVEFRAADDPGYPPCLDACWDAPPFLFIEGNLGEPDQPRLAVVGSRSTTAQTLHATEQLASEIARAGWQIVSGLAAGVDTAAHWAALKAGGSTVAVMGTGIQNVFPQENAELARAIVAKNGALVSQFPPDAPRSSTSFLIRNHVIAGLSNASVVMTGEERSGSRNEAQAAVGYGRLVYFWRPALQDKDWAHHLVTRGEAMYFDHPSEILGDLPK